MNNKMTQFIFDLIMLVIVLFTIQMLSENL